MPLGRIVVMNPVHVVGIGLSPEDLTEKHIKIIKEATVLVGGKRHLDYFKNHPAEKVVLTGDIKWAISEMKSRTDKKSWFLRWVIRTSSGSVHLLLNPLAPRMYTSTPISPPYPPHSVG
jgi:Precorrin-6B methylase 1